MKNYIHYIKYVVLFVLFILFLWFIYPTRYIYPDARWREFPIRIDRLTGETQVLIGSASGPRWVLAKDIVVEKKELLKPDVILENKKNTDTLSNEVKQRMINRMYNQYIKEFSRKDVDEMFREESLKSIK